MATAGKLTTVAENVPKVYHAGQMNVVENAECLKGGKTDTAILLDDISPVSHEMGVKVRGKNLFDKNNVNKLNAYINGSTITLGGQMSTVWVPCSPLTTYTVSKIESSRFWVCFTSEVPKIGITVNNKITNNASTQITNTSSDADKYIVIWLYHSNYDNDITESEILDSLQIELGSTASDYTPYIPDLTAVKVIKSNDSGEAVAEYTPNADGTVEGVTSLYPNTTLMTNTDGVIIDCEYYKDVDKAFDELTQAITDNL